MEHALANNICGNDASNTYSGFGVLNTQFAIAQITELEVLSFLI